MEGLALRNAGYHVSVVCPMGPGDPAFETIDGISIFKYPPPPVARGIVGYMWEYAFCLVMTMRLSLKAWRKRPFDVIQVCNPPDTLFLASLPFRLAGVKLVYDQHDLVPEMYLTKFESPKPALLKVLRMLERLTYRCAHHVVATNESYAHLAATRGNVADDRMTVVRSGPDSRMMFRGEPEPELLRSKQHLLVWLGIMGGQDGADIVLDALALLRTTYGRDDVGVAFLGFGDEYDNLVRQTTEMGLDDHVVFTGRVGPDSIRSYLSTASVGILPDPMSAYANLSTHNKTLEYMAHGLPVVASRLAETERTAAGAAVFVAPGDAAAIARAVNELLDDADRRQVLGEIGRNRIVNEYCWRFQAIAYVAVFDRLLGRQVDQQVGEQARS